MNKFIARLILKLFKSIKVKYACSWKFFMVVQIQSDFVSNGAVKNMFFNVDWAVEEDWFVVSETKIALDP